MPVLAPDPLPPTVVVEEVERFRAELKPAAR